MTPARWFRLAVYVAGPIIVGALLPRPLYGWDLTLLAVSAILCGRGCWLIGKQVAYEDAALQLAELREELVGVQAQAEELVERADRLVGPS